MRLAPYPDPQRRARTGDGDHDCFARRKQVSAGPRSLLSRLVLSDTLAPLGSGGRSATEAVVPAQRPPANRPGASASDRNSSAAMQPGGHGILEAGPPRISTARAPDSPRA